MAPHVSVVVPAFNNAAQIATTLRSVLSQTFHDFELIVSDHGSTDGTAELVEAFLDDPRVRLERISPGGGAHRNWNHVTSLATGDLVKLLCADDTLKPECLARQVAELEAAPDSVVMVAATRDVVDREGRTITRSRGLASLAGPVAAGTVARTVVRSGTNVLGEPGCVMFRRAALERAGMWDGRDGYVIDLRTYTNVLRSGDLIAMPESLATFRLSGGQWSVRLQTQQVRQVTRLLDELRSQWPGHVTRADLRRGRVMARWHAMTRRLAYVAFRNRL